MKKSITLRILISSAMLFIAVAAFSAPETTISNRSAATGSMFKQEYDRLSDNPAYVGAKTGNIEYQNSITKERTNLFTNLNGIASDGRLILGGSISFGVVGIGGWVDLRTSKTNPWHNDWSGFGAPLAVNTQGDGYGKVEDSAVNFTGTAGVYEDSQSAYGEQDLYETDNNVDAKIAVGGFAVGPMILGLSYERDTDGSSSRTGSGVYSYSDERIADAYISRTYDASFDSTDDVTVNNNIVNLGGIFELGGVLEAIEFNLGFRYNIWEQEAKNDGTIEDVYTDSYTRTYTGDIQTSNTAVELSDDRTTMDISIGVATREKIIEWSALSYIFFNIGLLNPEAGLSDTYQPYASNYSNAFDGNVNRVDSLSLTVQREREDDGASSMDFGAGITARKDLTKDLSFGFGLSYSGSMSEYKYIQTLSSEEITTVNNGDLLPTYDDYTLTETFSKKDDYTVESKNHSFSIPVGLEYRATENLSWRLGLVHTTSFSSVQTSWVNNKVSDFYLDYDREDVEGNETTDDEIANATTAASAIAGTGITLDQGERSGKTVEDTTTQTNTYAFGIGYAIEDTVQLDFLFNGDNNDSFEIDAWEIMLSATLVIGEAGESSKAPKRKSRKRR